jgi:hypothetical protein
MSIALSRGTPLARRVARVREKRETAIMRTRSPTIGHLQDEGVPDGLAFGADLLQRRKRVTTAPNMPPMIMSHQYWS